MSSNPKKLNIPANLNLDQLLIDYPATDYKGVNADNLAFICHSIIHLKAIHREDILKRNGLVPLNAKILSSVVYCYRPCLNYLIDIGVLTTDGSYTSGKSIGYDFTDSYLGQGFKKHDVKRLHIKRQIATSERKTAERRKKSLQSVKHLIPFFNSDKLRMDAKKALAWIEDSRELHLKFVAENSSIEDKDYYARRVRDRFDTYKISLENFESGNYYLSVDDTGYRFHSLLVNAKKELRNFLTYEGKELVSIDIKNSQPYFGLLLLKSSFYSSSRDKNICTLKDIYPELHTDLRRTVAWEKLKMFSKGSDGLAKRYISIEEYRKSVLSGKFYDEFVEQLKIYTVGRVNLTRAQAKKHIFTILFGNQAKYDKLTKSYRTFQSYYPDIAEIFSLFKSRPSEDEEKVKYQDLAIVLQRIESYMVLEVITKKFHTAFPDAPIFTIHDSIVTDQEHKEYLREIVCAELKKVIGDVPQLKEEIWKPENAKPDPDEGFLDDIAKW